jgi:hypothetical protein
MAVEEGNLSVQIAALRKLLGQSPEGADGVVTLSTGEREGPAALEISSSGDRLAPRVHRRGAEGAVRCSGGEVALDVEDGGMSGEKSLC